MKILRVISTMNPAMGGPSEGIRQSSKIISSLGHEIVIATLDNPKSDFLSSTDLNIVPLNSDKSSYGYSHKLKVWLDKYVPNFDAVLIQGLWQYHGLATANACRKHKVPYYVFTHGMLDPWFKHSYPIKHIKKWLYWPWAEYRTLRDARAVLFTSEEEKILARKSFWLL